MAFAETANLMVKMSLGGNFASQLKTNQRALSGFSAKLTDTQGRAYKAGQQIGTGIKNAARIAAVGLTVLGGLLVKAVKDGQDAARVQELYANAIRNSGKVSAQYVAILNEQQKALLQLGGVDDELIKTEQTRLIQMGLTGKQVAALTPLILDVAKATGKDLLTVTTAVGKAANGQTTALARLGIVLPKVKDKTKAFAVTMSELEKRFGGATAATSGDLATGLAVVREEMANISDDAGLRLLPSVTRIVSAVGKGLVPAFAKFVDRLLPSAVAGLDKLAQFLEGDGGTRALTAVSDTLQSFAAGAKITGRVIETAVKAFLSLPPELQKLAVGALAVNKLTGGLVTNIVAGIGGELFKKGGSPANPLWVASVNGGIGGGGIGGAAGTAAGIGTGAALVTVAAAVAASVIATMPFADKNNELKSQGLSPAEIAARKFAASDAAGQQWAIKHGYGPTGAKLSNAKPAMGPASVINAGGDTRSESRRLDMIRSATTIGSNRVRSAVLTSGSKTARAAQDGAHAQNRTRAALSAKLEKVRAAAERDRILRVTIPVKTFISGRLIASALGRYQPSSLTHHAGNGGA